MNLKQKLTSRKFLAAVVGLITGLSMIFGLDENTINTVAGAIVSVSSVMTYIITEGVIDATAVGNAANKVQDAIEQVQGDNTSN